MQSQTVCSDRGHSIENEICNYRGATRFYRWRLSFNIFMNDIVMANHKFNFILYADDTTLNPTLDCFGEKA